MITWAVGLLVGILPGIAADVAKKVVLFVVLGAAAAVLGGLTAYHLVTVHNAYERGATAAREQCARDAATVKQKAFAAYALLAKRLQAQLEKARVTDDKEGDADNAATGTGLERVLGKMKTDPECWSKEIVKELKR